MVSFLNYRNRKILIWTEAMGVASILKPSLQSYVFHHTYPINVFVFQNEISQIEEFTGSMKSVSLHSIANLRDLGFSSEDDYRELFRLGHRGTARFWSELIFGFPDVDYFVHLDSDNIYVDTIVKDILDNLDNHLFVGFRRPYFNHPAKMSLARRLRYYVANDKVHTFAFGFSREVARTHTASTLEQTILGSSRGRVSRFLNPVLDFFDQVPQSLDRKGSGTHFLHELGVQKPRRGEPSEKLFTEKILNFSAVGSGFNFWRNGHKDVPQSYVDYAISQFSIYNKYFLDFELDETGTVNKILENQLDRLDKTNWKLSPINEEKKGRGDVN